MPEEIEAMPPRRGTRRIWIAALLASVVSLGGLGLWSQRLPIARDLIDKTLASKGIAGQYRITAFGFRSQRIENIVLGDPTDPDLTAQSAELGFGWSGLWPRLAVLHVQGARIKGAIRNGRLSFGALDRLLPVASGEPFTLPDLDVKLSDVRLNLGTPAGGVRLSLEGEGHLQDGFEGRIAAEADALTGGGCEAARVRMIGHIAVAEHRPALDGPLRIADLRCGAVRLSNPQVALDIGFGEALDQWNGGAMLESGGLAIGKVAIRKLSGRIGFKGNSDDIDARAQLLFAGVTTNIIGSIDRKLAGLPVAPLASAVQHALERAAARGTIDAAFHLTNGVGNHRTLHIAPLLVRSASGATLELEANGRNGLGWRWPENQPIVDAKITLKGGGLPNLLLRVKKTERLEGRLDMAPYAAGRARLALDPVVLEQGRFTTRARIDGPIGDGWIEELDLKIAGETHADGTFLINRRCQTAGFEKLTVAGMQLGRTAFPICPLGSALIVRDRNGRLSGGGAIAQPRLSGTIGGTPASLAAERFAFSLAGPGFALDRLAIRLRNGSEPTRFDARRLTGNMTKDGLAGELVQAEGKIAAVPLLISQGSGHWRFGNGVLRLAGSALVDDAEADPRFHQLATHDIALELRRGVLEGSATLRRMPQDAAITAIKLRHDFNSGQGHADLAVRDLRFTESLQPEMLTRLTLGIIADVRGTVAGTGTIGWTRRGVTSSGDFTTSGLDFSAAFGPVKGLAGTVHFSDLLALETSPGQSVTIAQVNPGVAVERGVIHYQLERDQRLRIEDGTWPFSGGMLRLEPTVLEFGKPSERHLTFRVEGMDAAQFVQQFEFKNIAISGVFDGILPMTFDAQGGRIEGGRLVVREGGGTLAYVGEISNAKLGRFGNMAFDALKSIRYSNLAIELNGALDGEIVSKVIFSGTNEAPVAVRKGLLGGLVGLPFKFNITVTAPFRSLINSAQSINDPRGLVKNSLETYRARQRQPDVQPAESGRAP